MPMSAMDIDIGQLRRRDQGARRSRENMRLAAQINLWSESSRSGRM